MKSKRLLIFIAVVAIVLVIMILLSALFSVQQAWVVFHRFDGTTTFAPEQGAPTIEDILNKAKGKNIIFLSKSELLKSLQTDNWHAMFVVKQFPNRVEVHFFERTLAAKIVVGGKDIFIDSKGNVVTNTDGKACVNISSAFALLDVVSQEVNQPLKFASEANNQRLQQILQVLLTVWRCNIEFEDIPAVLGSTNVFTYENDKLMIEMPSGAKFEVHAPHKDLENRLIDAFSAYYNAENTDYQKDGVVIVVREDGKITTDMNK